MPSASDALRNLMEKWFGDPVSDEGPFKFLLARGWTDRGGIMDPPVAAHNPSREEMACLRFLRDEWDYDFRYMCFDSEVGQGTYGGFAPILFKE